MPSTELVDTTSERQVRSYHRAFLGELTLYTFGGDLRPWRPIPARGIFWAGGLEIVVLLFTHTLGVSLPVGAINWIFVYLVIPISLSWVFTVAKIEGRRLHVAISAWIKHALLGYHLAGGYQRLPRIRPIGHSKIKVSSEYVQPKPHLTYRYASIVVFLLLVVWIGLRSSSAPSPKSPIHHHGVVVAGIMTKAPFVFPTATKTFPVSTKAVVPVRHEKTHKALPPLHLSSRSTTIGIARQFAGAYLSYEIGRDTPSVRAQLRVTCTPQFAALLIGSPISLPPPQMHSLSYRPFHLDAVSYRPSKGARSQLVVAKFSNPQGAHGILHIYIQVNHGSGRQVAGLS